MIVHARACLQPEGTIWLVACPVLLPARERTTFSLSVSSPQQLLKLGTSPVFGKCKGTKKATGAPCGKVSTSTLHRLLHGSQRLLQGRAVASSLCVCIAGCGRL